MPEYQIRQMIVDQAFHQFQQACSNQLQRILLQSNHWKRLFHHRSYWKYFFFLINNSLNPPKYSKNSQKYYRAYIFFIKLISKYSKAYSDIVLFKIFHSKNRFPFKLTVFSIFLHQILLWISLWKSLGSLSMCSVRSVERARLDITSLMKCKYFNSEIMVLEWLYKEFSRLCQECVCISPSPNSGFMRRWSNGRTRGEGGGAKLC